MSSQDNYFESGTIVAANDVCDIHNGGSNPGMDDAKREADIALTLPGQVSGIISGMRTSRAGMPSWITRGPISAKNIKPDGVEDGPDDGGAPVPGTLYIVEDKAEFEGTHHSVAVVAKEIVVKGDAHVYNVVLAAQEKLVTDSNVTVGHADFCETGKYSAYLFSEEKELEISSNNFMYGVQIVSNYEIKLQSGNPSLYKSVYAETSGPLSYQSNNTLAACDDAIISHFGTSNNPFGIKTLSLVR